MDADLGPGGAGADLHEVTQLVGYPHPLPSPGVGGAAAAAGQRVGDMPGVLYLADQLICGCPDGECPVGGGVAVGVGGEFADRDDEITGAAGGRAGLARVPGGECPDRAQVVPVSQHGGVSGGGVQWRVAFRGSTMAES
jgi:hypothetical protein